MAFLPTPACQELEYPEAKPLETDRFRHMGLRLLKLLA